MEDLKGSRVIAKGCKSDTLYPFHVSSVNDHVAVIEEPIVSLWHSRLGHESKWNVSAFLFGLLAMSSLC